MMKPYFSEGNQTDVADNRNVHPLIRTLFPERLSQCVITSFYEFRKDDVHIPSNEEILQGKSEIVKKQLCEVRRRKDILETKYRILKPILDNNEIGTYELRISQVSGWEEKLKRTADRIEAKLSEESVKEKIIQ